MTVTTYNSDVKFYAALFRFCDAVTFGTKKRHTFMFSVDSKIVLMFEVCYNVSASSI